MTSTFTRAMCSLLSRATAVLVLIATPSIGAAQAPMPTARNAVYFELGGNALFYSLNYDRRLNDTWTGRAGLMFVSASGADVETRQRVDLDLAILPVMMNALLGRGANRLELGVGPLFAFAGGRLEDTELGVTEEALAAGLAGVTSTIGYRRQPAAGGFVFRASLNPFYSGSAQIWAGLSVGWSF